MVFCGRESRASVVDDVRDTDDVTDAGRDNKILEICGHSLSHSQPQLTKTRICFILIYDF